MSEPKPEGFVCIRASVQSRPFRPWLRALAGFICVAFTLTQVETRWAKAELPSVSEARQTSSLAPASELAASDFKARFLGAYREGTRRQDGIGKPPGGLVSFGRGLRNFGIFLPFVVSIFMLVEGCTSEKPHRAGKSSPARSADVEGIEITGAPVVQTPLGKVQNAIDSYLKGELPYQKLEELAGEDPWAFVQVSEPMGSRFDEKLWRLEREAVQTIRNIEKETDDILVHLWTAQGEPKMQAVKQQLMRFPEARVPFILKRLIETKDDRLLRGAVLAYRLLSEAGFIPWPVTLEMIKPFIDRVASRQGSGIILKVPFEDALRAGLREAGIEHLFAYLDFKTPADVKPGDLLAKISPAGRKLAIAILKMRRSYRQDPDDATRWRALGLLLSLQRDEAAGSEGLDAVALVMVELPDADPKRWDAALKVLVEIGKDAVPVLIEGLKSDHLGVRLKVAKALSELGPDAKDAIPALVALFKNTQTLGNVTTEAAEMAQAVAAIGPDAIPALRRVLLNGENSPGERWPAAMALGRIGPAAIPALAEALRNPDVSVRKNAVSAIRAIGPAGKAAVPALQEALGDSDVDVRQNAASVLGGIGADAKSAVAGLIQVLIKDSISVRREAIGALGKIGPDAKEAVPHLMEFLINDRWMLREEAAEALGAIGDLSALPAVIEVEGGTPHHDPPKVSSFFPGESKMTIEKAKDALLSKAIKEGSAGLAVPALIKVLKEGRIERRRKEAAKALGEIGDPSALPVLREALDSSKDSGVQDASRRAIEALERKQKEGADRKDEAPPAEQPNPQPPKAPGGVPMYSVLPLAVARVDPTLSLGLLGAAAIWVAWYFAGKLVARMRAHNDKGQGSGHGERAAGGELKFEVIENKLGALAKKTQEVLEKHFRQDLIYSSSGVTRVTAERFSKVDVELKFYLADEKVIRVIAENVTREREPDFQKIDSDFKNRLESIRPTRRGLLKKAIGALIAVGIGGGVFSLLKGKRKPVMGQEDLKHTYFIFYAVHIGASEAERLIPYLEEILESAPVDASGTRKLIYLEESVGPPWENVRQALTADPEFAEAIRPWALQVRSESLSAEEFDAAFRKEALSGRYDAFLEKAYPQALERLEEWFQETLSRGEAPALRERGAKNFITILQQVALDKKIKVLRESPSFEAWLIMARQALDRELAREALFRGDLEAYRRFMREYCLAYEEGGSLRDEGFGRLWAELAKTYPGWKIVAVRGKDHRDNHSDIVGGLPLPVWKWSRSPHLEEPSRAYILEKRKRALDQEEELEFFFREEIFSVLTPRRFAKTGDVDDAFQYVERVFQSFSSRGGTGAWFKQWMKKLDIESNPLGSKDAYVERLLKALEAEKLINPNDLGGVRAEEGAEGGPIGKFIVDGEIATDLKGSIENNELILKTKGEREVTRVSVAKATPDELKILEGVLVRLKAKRQAPEHPLSDQERAFLEATLGFLEEMIQKGEVYVLGEGPFLHGFSNANFLSISRALLDNPVAVLHEAGHGAAAKQGLTRIDGLDIHKFLRGAGKKERAEARTKGEPFRLGLQDKVFGEAANDGLSELLRGTPQDPLGDLLTEVGITDPKLRALAPTGEEGARLLEVIERAIRNHENLDSEKVALRLEALLGVKNPALRILSLRAMEVLFEIDPKASTEARAQSLIPYLEDPEMEVRIAAHDALGIGILHHWDLATPGVASSLVRLLKSEDGEVHHDVVHLMVRLFEANGALATRNMAQLLTSEFLRELHFPDEEDDLSYGGHLLSFFLQIAQSFEALFFANPKAATRGVVGRLIEILLGLRDLSASIYLPMALDFALEANPQVFRISEIRDLLAAAIAGEGNPSVKAALRIFLSRLAWQAKWRKTIPAEIRDFVLAHFASTEAFRPPPHVGRILIKTEIEDLHPVLLRAMADEISEVYESLASSLVPTDDSVDEGLKARREEYESLIRAGILRWEHLQLLKQQGLAREEIVSYLERRIREHEVQELIRNGSLSAFQQLIKELSENELLEVYALLTFEGSTENLPSLEKRKPFLPLLEAEFVNRRGEAPRFDVLDVATRDFFDHRDSLQMSATRIKDLLKSNKVNEAVALLVPLISGGMENAAAFGDSGFRPDALVLLPLLVDFDPRWIGALEEAGFGRDHPELFSHLIFQLTVWLIEKKDAFGLLRLAKESPSGFVTVLSLLTRFLIGGNAPGIGKVDFEALKRIDAERGGAFSSVLAFLERIGGMDEEGPTEPGGDLGANHILRRPNDRYKEAEKLLEEKRYEEALKAFREAIGGTGFIGYRAIVEQGEAIGDAETLSVARKFMGLAEEKIKEIQALLAQVEFDDLMQKFLKGISDPEGIPALLKEDSRLSQKSYVQGVLKSARDLYPEGGVQDKALEALLEATESYDLSDPDGWESYTNDKVAEHLWAFLDRPAKEEIEKAGLKTIFEKAGVSPNEVEELLNAYLNFSKSLIKDASKESVLRLVDRYPHKEELILLLLKKGRVVWTKGRLSAGPQFLEGMDLGVDERFLRASIHESIYKGASFFGRPFDSELLPDHFAGHALPVENVASVISSLILMTPQDLEDRGIPFVSHDPQPELKDDGDEMFVFFYRGFITSDHTGELQVGIMVPWGDFSPEHNVGLRDEAKSGSVDLRNSVFLIGDVRLVAGFRTVFTHNSELEDRYQRIVFFDTGSFPDINDFFQFLTGTGVGQFILRARLEKIKALNARIAPTDPSKPPIPSLPKSLAEPSVAPAPVLPAPPIPLAEIEQAQDDA